MNTYHITFQNGVDKAKLKKISVYGTLTYLGNNQYKIEVEEEKANLFIVIHSKNGVTIIPY